jgi:8-oxo-dGTP diphosphatase
MSLEKKQKYHVLARGVVLSGEYVLVAHCKGMDNTFLPGGHVELGEGMRTSLSREIKEELGLDSIVKGYLGAIEADYEYKEVYHQEICHIFEVEMLAVDHTRNPESQEAHLEFYWIPIAEMEAHNLLPLPLRGFIRNFVNRETGPFFETTLSC